MKKILSFIVIIFCMTASLSAQEKKAFTLNDVIPGGSNYFNLTPKNMPGLQWWEDVCVRADVEDIKRINNRTGEESVIVTLEEVNEALQNGEKPYELSLPIKPLRTLQGASLPWGNRNIVMFSYTAGDHLYVANQGDFSKAVSPHVSGEKETDNDIVYGQSVHRNEFGIMKGTFWSPKGTYLAFYRMDQSMVTDYPQVNTTTRIATLVPDKYPMAGMTSHKVTIGIYNVKTGKTIYLQAGDPKTGKTIYLQAGDPTDRYFTNISWAPNEKDIYVIELNRDQNHAQLVRYDAATGEKKGVLYEEKHTRYVEPQHPLAFLPWDESKFIYWSQRDVAGAGNLGLQQEDEDRHYRKHGNLSAPD